MLLELLWGQKHLAHRLDPLLLAHRLDPLLLGLPELRLGLLLLGLPEHLLAL